MTVERTQKTYLKVSDNTEICVVGKEGFVIKDTLQQISIAIFPEEIDDLILKLQEAKEISKKSQ